MVAREAQRVNRGSTGEATLDPNVQSLLDHIATELAEEYIRLMEAAAGAEDNGPGADREATGGDER